VLVNERGEPFGRMGIARSNAGWRSAKQVCQRIGAFELRIGIHVGDIIIEEGDIFGDGVNIAARLNSGCSPPLGPCAGARGGDRPALILHAPGDAAEAADAV
jgi:hypothetical protein